MSLMELNFATGLRAQLEAEKNKSLLYGASIALGSFSALQNKITQMVEGLSTFEDINPPLANTIPKDITDVKPKAIAIPAAVAANPSNNDENDSDDSSDSDDSYDSDDSDEEDEEDENKKGRRIHRKKGPSGKPLLNFIRFKTRHAAFEAAKRAGKGGRPIHHAKDRHFHPNKTANDMKGLDKNILKNGDHYCY